VSAWLAFATCGQLSAASAIPSASASPGVGGAADPGEQPLASASRTASASGDADRAPEAPSLRRSGRGEEDLQEALMAALARARFREGSGRRRPA
jgi:hypothetical protein